MTSRFAGWFTSLVLGALVVWPPVGGLAATPKTSSAPTSDLSLKISDNGRYLVDQKGSPFLVVGDSPWSLIVQLDDKDRATYLEDRQKRGFNSIIVNLLEHEFCTLAPRTRSGLAPEDNHNIVTEGYGSDTATALTAATADGKLSVTYIPSTDSDQRELTIAMGRFPKPVSARWYNPTNGQFVEAEESPYANRAVEHLHAPSPSSPQANDWVLILDAR
jgi:hypothetical protein